MRAPALLLGFRTILLAISEGRQPSVHYVTLGPLEGSLRVLTGAYDDNTESDLCRTSPSAPGLDS